MSELTDRLEALKRKQDGVDMFTADDVRTVVEGIEYAMAHGGTVSIETEPIAGGGGYVISIIDAEGNVSEITLKDGGDAYEVYKSTVPSGETPMSKTDWLASLKGADGQNGAKGDDAVNPFKGWYDTLAALQGAVGSPKVGDFAYIKGATASEPAAIYECTTAGTWSDSGRTVDASNVQTFETGQALNGTAIDNTGLGNPAGNALAKAGDVMQLAAKLEGVTATAEKVQLVTSGAEQNVFAGYIPVKTVSPATKYIYKDHATTKSVVVALNEGVKSLRFLSRITTSQNVVTGYLFLNIGDAALSSIMQNGVDFTEYVVESHEWEQGSTESVANKVLAIPDGATHFVTVYNTGSLLTESAFYCYKMVGVAAAVDGVSTYVTLNYGTVTGNRNSAGALYDVNGRIGMKNEALSFHQYVCSPFIEASGYFNVLGSPTLHGVILCYDKNFSYVCQRILKANNVLPDGVEFVKLCAITHNNTIGLTWGLGGINNQGVDEANVNRIRTNGYFDIDDFGTFLADREMRFYVKFYDANHNYKGGFLRAVVGNMLTRGYMLNNYYADGTGGTMEQVKYVRLVCAYPNNVPIDPASHPVLYSPRDSNVTPIRFDTIGGRLVKDRNDYGKTLRCVYDTKVNKLQLPDSGAVADTNKYYSTMMLRLPKSYSADGMPTKLIIFKSGADTYDDIFEKDYNDFYYLDYLKYWVDQGYAVMDFYGSTSKYPATDCFGFATGVASAVSAYEYVVKTFNIDPSGVYLSCKSLGGYIAHELLFNGCIPIKAAALLAPAIDNKKQCFGYNSQERGDFVADMGLTGDASVLSDSSIPLADRPYSEGVKNYVKTNIDKLLGYLPMLNGIINKTVDEWLELVVTTQGSFAEVKRIHRVPTKYWVAPDDTATPYEIAENYVMSCKNTFSPVYLRTMPSGTGGHHSVDTDAAAPKVASITTRLGVTYTNVPVAYVEALDFLERY